MNIKNGLEYFPFDVDFFDDEKIQYVSAKFGIKGEIIAIRLLTRIYRSGYFLEWDDDSALLLSKKCGDGVTAALIIDVVDELLKRNFLSKTLYDSFKILTSKGIQKRFFEAAKRRKNVKVILEYLLIDAESIQNVDVTIENVNILTQDADILKQSKVKYSKVKKSKESDIPFETFWNLYDKKIGNEIKLSKKWDSLTSDERQRAIEYIPKYKECQPEKAFRKNPESFLENKGWQDELIKSSNKSKENGINGKHSSQVGKTIEFDKP